MFPGKLDLLFPRKEDIIFPQLSSGWIKDEMGVYKVCAVIRWEIRLINDDRPSYGEKKEAVCRQSREESEA